MKSIGFILFKLILKFGLLFPQDALFDENGKTALINAVQKNDIQLVESLIDQGADVNLKEKKGLQGTPLMYATYAGNVALCQLLIEEGADVNSVDINKDPAINWAAYYGKVSIINYLIEKGADFNMISKHGNAIDVALRLWHHDSVVDVFRTYYKAKNLNRKEQKIIQAAIYRDSQVLMEQWTSKLLPDLKDPLGIPLLQFAAQSNDLEAAKFLINQGVDVNILNRVGQTPLAWAARFGHLDMAKLLLESGADPNKTDSRYRLTPLIASSLNDKIEIAELLLEYGAKIEHRETVNNASALHWAIFQNNLPLVELLVNNGADHHEKALENNAYSAYDMAVNYKNEELKYLFDSIDEKDKRKQLIGSWKLQEIHYQYKDTTYVVKDEDHGRFIFSKSNYALMYNPMMQKRTAFENLSKPSSEEISRAFRTIVFNTGSYKIADSILRTTTDIAKVPGFEGGQQFYRISRNKHEMELVMYDETYPNGDKPEWYRQLKIKFILIKE